MFLQEAGRPDEHVPSAGDRLDALAGVRLELAGGLEVDALQAARRDGAGSSWAMMPAWESVYDRSYDRSRAAPTEESAPSCNAGTSSLAAHQRFLTTFRFRCTILRMGKLLIITETCRNE